jgi:cysteinyl-tRNA synthetase
MREIRLHDTRSGELLALRPREEGRVGIYTCGPTVYSRIHIGNARPFVIFSLLKRFLEHEEYGVTLVVNITDVNDKIYAAVEQRGAVETESPAGVLGDGDSGVPRSERLAREMTAQYRVDTDALGLGRPDHEPLASESMDAIVDYIQTLIDSEHAYESGGDVFFRVRSDTDYGSLSHRRLEDLDQGEDGSDAHPPSDRKQDQLDFALWKANKPGEDTSWPSPWGKGRPGWHIECSAMAEGLLGVGFDIHGGGSDLVFPHHENEAAQTRCARGAELARIWMHNGMIQLTGEKMAKSAGNIALLHEVVEEYGRDAVVMYLVGGHYRQPLAFSPSELEDADRRVHRIRDALRRLEPGRSSPPDMAIHVEAFFAALANDFNTPTALAALFEWVREANRRGGGVGDADLRGMLAVLGLEALTPLKTVGDMTAIDPEAMSLLNQREQARGSRDFQTADRIRDELHNKGYEIRDGPDGAELIFSSSQ